LHQQTPSRVEAPRQGRAAFWYVVQLFNKHRPKRTQAIDDKFVVNNLVAHINRCPPFQDRHFHDLDRPINTRTEPARGRKKKGQGWFRHGGLMRHSQDVVPTRAKVYPEGGATYPYALDKKKPGSVLRNPAVQHTVKVLLRLD
jgi:hypothetical protein